MAVGNVRVRAICESIYFVHNGPIMNLILDSDSACSNWLEVAFRLRSLIVHYNEMFTHPRTRYCEKVQSSRAGVQEALKGDEIA